MKKNRFPAAAQTVNAVHSMYRPEKDSFGVVHNMYKSEKNIFGVVRNMYKPEKNIFGIVHNMYKPKKTFSASYITCTGPKTENLHNINHL
jgi:hypothetical protein